MLAPYSDRWSFETGVDRLMVVADNVESDVALEFAQRECRMSTRIVLAQFVGIAECCAGKQVKLAHLCADQALDVPPKAGLAGRPPVNLDTGILAAALECAAAEVTAIIHMEPIREASDGPGVCYFAFAKPRRFIKDRMQQAKACR